MEWINLSDAILHFGIHLYGGSELSKDFSKCLVWMRKMRENEADLNFFNDGQKFWS